MDSMAVSTMPRVGSSERVPYLDRPGIATTFAALLPGAPGVAVEAYDGSRVTPKGRVTTRIVVRSPSAIARIVRRPGDQRGVSVRTHLQCAVLVGIVFFASVSSGWAGAGATVPAQVRVGANPGNGIRAAETKSGCTTSDEGTCETNSAQSADLENSFARIVHGRALHESWAASVLGK
jgi:hypothetical protein